MKKLICAILVVLTTAATFGQARLGVYPWNVTLKVVDDTGNPVTKARAWVSYGSPKEGESIDPFNSVGWAVAGLTDTNGTFVASHADRSWTLGINIKKDGYYPTSGSYQLYVPGQFDEQKVAANRNATFTMTLKKIGKPIPMYAKRIDEEPPANSQPVGYDLEMGDWVGPYGKGVNSDIIFTREYNRKSLQDYDYTLTVNFPNSGDGIQEFTAPAFAQEGLSSELRSSQKAPADGYQQKWVQTDNRHPGKPIGTNRDPHHNYYFRVRTKIDDRGNIVSAHYGKIYGDFMQFKYYLNPTPNSRNIEFDPKQNLLKNLKLDEGVSEP